MQQIIRRLCDLNAAGKQQLTELAEFLLAQVAELTAVQVADGTVEPRKKGKPLVLNANVDAAAVGIFAAAPVFPADPAAG